MTLHAGHGSHGPSELIRLQRENAAFRARIEALEVVLKDARKWIAEAPPETWGVEVYDPTIAVQTAFLRTIDIVLGHQQTKDAEKTPDAEAEKTTGSLTCR